MPDLNVVSQKTGLLRPLLLASAGAVVLGGVGWLAFRPEPLPAAVQISPAAITRSVPAAPSPVTPAVPPSVTATVTPAATAPAPQAAPTFDIVRVTPRGDTVVAGRAEPNAEVSLRENGQEIGRTQADAMGQFVILPNKPLAPGGQELSLASRAGNAPEIKGEAPVVVLVPEPAKPGQAAASTPQLAPQVLLTPAAEVPRLLQAPSAPGNKLSLNVVDYDERGEIRFAGAAPPGTVLRVYVDNKPVGDAQVDSQGRWSLQPGSTVTSGDHRLRVDQVTQAGGVASRIELPFQRTSIPAVELAAGRVVVQPRQNLWRLARQAYGQGVRYTVIYEANRDQIQDPNRIYPGQVIAVPQAASGPSARTR